jgi:hypothetical protein
MDSVLKDQAGFVEAMEMDSLGKDQAGFLGSMEMDLVGSSEVVAFGEHQFGLVRENMFMSEESSLEGFRLPEFLESTRSLSFKAKLLADLKRVGCG